MSFVFSAIARSHQTEASVNKGKRTEIKRLARKPFIHENHPLKNTSLSQVQKQDGRK